MEPSRQTRSSYGPPYPLGRWSSVTFARFSPAPVGLFSRSRLPGYAGGPSVHHGASLGPGRAPCSVCSGRSKSRNVASNRGIVRGSKAHTTPPQMLFFFSPFFHLSAAVIEVPQQLSKARWPRYSSRASSFSRCDSLERCFCVWARELACVLSVPLL